MYPNDILHIINQTYKNTLCDRPRSRKDNSIMFSISAQVSSQEMFYREINVNLLEDKEMLQSYQY